jgi:hypothetical protein
VAFGTLPRHDDPPPETDEIKDAGAEADAEVGAEASGGGIRLLVLTSRLVRLAGMGSGGTLLNGGACALAVGVYGGTGSAAGSFTRIVSSSINSS